MAMTEPPRVAVLGEVMLEFSRGSAADPRYRLNYAGDSYNTAVTLARLGVATAYVSLLGPDRYSDDIVAHASAEGLDTDGLLRDDSGLPGMYMIRTDTAGERRFDYWRSDSVARRLLQDPQRVERVYACLARSPWLYLSGITMAVIGLSAPAVFWRLLERLRDAGVRFAFDPNWRPALWADRQLARQMYRRLIAMCAWTFPTYDDESALWGFDSAEAVLDWHAGLGVSEIVLKCPQAEAVADVGGRRIHRRSDYAGPVVDTTGAGDAFNAGYMAARLAGADVGVALEQAHASAARTLACSGAIPDRVC